MIYLFIFVLMLFIFFFLNNYVVIYFFKDSFGVFGYGIFLSSNGLFFFCYKLILEKGKGK